MIEPYSILPTTYLLRPRELYPGVETPEEYLEVQRASILAKMAQFRHLRWRLPFRHLGTPAPLKVSDSQWQLVCPCGGYPSYDPEWALAACFTCGATYHQTPPADWREIERVLVNRPRLQNRHMLVGQTLDELRAENRAHGDPD